MEDMQEVLARVKERAKWAKDADQGALENFRQEIIGKAHALAKELAAADYPGATPEWFEDPSVEVGSFRKYWHFYQLRELPCWNIFKRKLDIVYLTSEGEITRARHGKDTDYRDQVTPNHYAGYVQIALYEALEVLEDSLFPRRGEIPRTKIFDPLEDDKKKALLILEWDRP